MINWINISIAPPPTAVTIILCNVKTNSGLLGFGVYNIDTGFVTFSGYDMPLHFFTHWAEINLPGEE